MQESYYKKELTLLDSLKEKKKVLLHSCCAPCSSHVITFLTNYFDITILYYNPNISPISEYKKRKEEQIRLIKSIKNEILNEIDYQKEGISKLDKVIVNIEDLIIENIIQNKDKLIIDSLFSK